MLCSCVHMCWCCHVYTYASQLGESGLATPPHPDVSIHPLSCKGCTWLHANSMPTGCLMAHTFTAAQCCRGADMHPHRGTGPWH